MKSFLFLLFILASTFSYAQEPIHFLFTTEGKVQISEPLCFDMIKDAEELLDLQMKQVKKSGFLAIEHANLNEQAFLLIHKTLYGNPKDYAAAYYPIIFIYNSYGKILKQNLFASLQEVRMKGLVSPSIQIQFRNVVVSPSQTSVDIDIIDLEHPNTPISTNHFFYPTGPLLQESKATARWFHFWRYFYKVTEMPEWLLAELYKINNKLISEKQSNQALELKLKELSMNAPTYLNERVAKLKEQLIGLPTDLFNLEATQGILMSSDERKFFVYTVSENPEINWMNPEDTSKIFESTAWVFLFDPNGELHYGVFDHNYVSQDQSKTQLNKFYSAAFTPAPELAYNEAQWLAPILDEEAPTNFVDFHILRHDTQSEETSQLIITYIEPVLKQYVTDSSRYNNFYQRLTTGNISENFFDDDIYATLFKDYLLSNPEKTAFIYPVLLQHRSVQEREYYYTQEDFKFYVLLKNEQGTFDLYDWHYFSALPYKNYYSLLTCAHSHLKKISNWDGESDIINDPAFWNNFIVKKSDRGFDYLTMLTTKDQSPMVARAEFEAQVKDCYKLLSEQDVADLYPNQLKQVILCLNTIQTYNLKGKDEMQLTSLATQLHFEKRLNKVQEFVGHYYPMLHLEFGGNLQPHSYYLLK